MEELIIEDKKDYLTNNYPFENPPALEEEIVCLHCNRISKVGDYKVYKDEWGDEYICCAYMPDCDGTVIDWIPLG
ncbi:hypothetical protein ACLI09_01805 [Flavobacterium sp. RHBU_24]|uniref:hypothetical protein n=1 Tax=Flavobacterium sp. RHBU_24 TaxID=3391185 RepID=UPI003984880E